jgi:surfeit locus 1 family protein
LARDAVTLTAQVHRRVALQGQWQPQWTVYLENRPMNGRVGFYVLTPLTLADGTSVIVQRGWQPRDVTDRTKVVEPLTPTSAVEVKGRVALSASRLFEFEHADSGRIRQNLDLQAFAQQTRLKLRPLAIVQEGDDVADGLLRDWPALASDVHKHYGYAFQWFALCALTIGLYVWFQIIRPRRTPV